MMHTRRRSRTIYKSASFGRPASVPNLIFFLFTGTKTVGWLVGNGIKKAAVFEKEYALLHISIKTQFF